MICGTARGIGKFPVAKYPPTDVYYIPEQKTFASKVPDMKKMLVLLAGQSNMSGRGYLTENDMTEIPGITALRRDMVWIPAADPFNYDRLGTLGLSNAADPFEVKGLEFNGNRRCGVGPGRTFAIALKELYPGNEIGLIPVSIGGTGINSWLPGGKDKHSDMHPYDDAVKMAREAMKEGELVAVLWHQGETDAKNDTPDYKELLKTVIANFRNDLGIEEVPFILGGLGDFLDPQWDVPRYNNIIREVASEMPHCGFVSAGGLNHRGDNLHFDTPSQYILGNRYFQEFCRLNKII